MIRPSQFILVYGPGAILEGPRGPRVIPNADAGLFRSRGLEPQDFRIDDDRMSKGILGGKMIFRLPSNGELRIPSGEYLYRTMPFPRWKMCMNKSGHRNAYFLYRDNKNGHQPCPVCQDYRKSPGATRFIVACPYGHMDEVPWNYIVHGSAGCSVPNKGGSKHAQDGNGFLFRSGGGTLSSIDVECVRCGAKASFGDAYGRDFKCSGRHPEDEPPGSNGRPYPAECRSRAKIIQRQASNLRVPVVETHFTIRPLVTETHTCMAKPEIWGVWAQPPRPSSKEDLLARLDFSYQHGRILAQDMEQIRESSWDVLEDAMNSAMERQDAGFIDMIKDEFRELLRAAKEGAPPSRPPNNERVLFEVERNSTIDICRPGGMKLQVTPVKRLRTVTVQTGFRRMIETGGSPDSPSVARTVDISFDFKGKDWYPGVEFLGEGVFVSSRDRVVKDDGGAAGRWSNARSDEYDPSITQHESFRELDPQFVWWHTLSHALIRTLSEHAGYSAASIRERVYVEEVDGMRVGGILLYATQPGNDGTMGGLISMVPSFDSVLRASMERVGSCSGDPLCRRQRFGSGGLNGAACYGCVMNSETSCEHRNMWLDRHLLLENRP